MPLLPNDAADTAAAAAAHLWHLTYQLGSSPGKGWPGAMRRWCDLAVELTHLSEQLRSAAAGRHVVPFDDGRVAHAAAIRVMFLEMLEVYQGEHPQPAVLSLAPPPLAITANAGSSHDVVADADFEEE